MTTRLRVFVLIVLATALTVGAIWVFKKDAKSRKYEIPVVATTSNVSDHEVSVPLTQPSPEPSPSPTLPPPVESPSQLASSPQPSPTNELVGNSYAGKMDLIIPVAGVQRGQLIDTFTQARSEGRVHDAIDIPAAANTPVFAAADGQIVKLFQSERGGTTIYQSSVDKKLIFYYAHLSRYADGITEGKQVRQGETIAYVGDTGNAGAGNYHLHFSISIVSDPKLYWEGTNINPYPLLRRQ